MVFGFGKKEIEIIPDKYSYSPGENISGKVKLTLKKPTDGRQLRAELIGMRTTIRTGRGSVGKDKRYIYDFKMPLDGEKTYSGAEYCFQMKIPVNILQTVSMPSNAVGEVLKAAQFLSGAHVTISWYIKAVLDRPGKKDITSKNVQVVIG